MKIFLIAYSHVGKSTLGELLVDNIDNSVLFGASSWVRESCLKNSSVEEMTTYAKNILSVNPWYSINYIKNKIDPEKISIIDGVRNPFDFTHLFDYTKDIVIFLSRAGVGPSSSFEKTGILSIRSYIEFLLSEDFISKNRAIKIHFKSFNKYSRDEEYFLPTAFSYDRNLLQLEDLREAIDPIIKCIKNI